MNNIRPKNNKNRKNYKLKLKTEKIIKIKIKE